MPSGTLTLLPGVLLTTITVRIIDDNTPELDEYFRVRLQRQVEDVTITSSTAQVMIIDTDGEDECYYSVLVP